MTQIYNDIIQIIQEPQLFLGFVTLLGLILQRKNLSDILTGTIKTIIGVTILLFGVDLLSQSLMPLTYVFETLYALDKTTSLTQWNNFTTQYGGTIGFVLLFGFAGNLLIARFTPLKSIFLTMHIAFFFAMTMVAVGVENGLRGATLIIFATIFYILYVTIMPHLTRPAVKNLTKADDFTIGHTASIFCILGDVIGRLFTKKRDLENLTISQNFYFIKDPSVMSGLVLTFLYFIIFLMVDRNLYIDAVETISFNQSHKHFILLDSIKTGLLFAAALMILLMGVRLIVSELLPAFKGIADKLVPNAIPALDIPLVFPFGPNSLLIGFLVALATSIGAIFLLESFRIFPYAIVPMTVACYFDVAPGAIFANKRGGIWAAITTSFIGGFLMVVMVGIAIPMTARTIGKFTQAFGGNDFSLWIMISNFFGSLF